MGSRTCYCSARFCGDQRCFVLQNRSSLRISLPALYCLDVCRFSNHYRHMAHKSLKIKLFETLDIYKIKLLYHCQDTQHNFTQKQLTQYTIHRKNYVKKYSCILRWSSSVSKFHSNTSNRSYNDVWNFTKSICSNCDCNNHCIHCCNHQQHKYGLQIKVRTW